MRLFRLTLGQYSWRQSATFRYEHDHRNQGGPATHLLNDSAESSAVVDVSSDGTLPVNLDTGFSQSRWQTGCGSDLKARQRCWVIRKRPGTHVFFGTTPVTVGILPAFRDHFGVERRYRGAKKPLQGLKLVAGAVVTSLTAGRIFILVRQAKYHDRATSVPCDHIGLMNDH
jgi:hypothetical protein